MVDAPPVRRLLATLLLSGLLAVAAVVVASPASACSCAPATTEEYFARADAVFTGRLVSREVAHTGPVSSSGDPALHVFAVDAVYKGTANQEQGVVSPQSSASCGLELAGDGRVVVFASRSGDEVGSVPALGQYAASLCGGSGPVDAAVEAELAALRGPSSDPPSAPAASAAGNELVPTRSSLLVPGLVAAGLVLLVAGGLAVRRRAR